MVVKDNEFYHIRIEHLVRPFPLYLHTFKPNLTFEWVEISIVDLNENMLRKTSHNIHRAIPRTLKWRKSTLTVAEIR